MFEPTFQISEDRFNKIDPGFSESARCIFVHKNNLAPHSLGRSEKGKPRNSAFLNQQIFISTSSKLLI